MFSSFFGNKKTSDKTSDTDSVSNTTMPAAQVDTNTVIPPAAPAPVVPIAQPYGEGEMDVVDIKLVGYHDEIEGDVVKMAVKSGDQTNDPQQTSNDVKNGASDKIIAKSNGATHITTLVGSNIPAKMQNAFNRNLNQGKKGLLSMATNMSFETTKENAIANIRNKLRSNTDTNSAEYKDLLRLLKVLETSPLVGTAWRSIDVTSAGDTIQFTPEAKDNLNQPVRFAEKLYRHYIAQTGTFANKLTDTQIKEDLNNIIANLIKDETQKGYLNKLVSEPTTKFEYVKVNLEKISNNKHGKLKVNTNGLITLKNDSPVDEYALRNILQESPYWVRGGKSKKNKKFHSKKLQKSYKKQQKSKKSSKK